MELEANRYLAFAREHIGIVASSALVLIISIRVFVVAGYEPKSALAVLQFGGSGSVMIGGVLGAMPVVLALALYVGLFWYLISAPRRREIGMRGAWTILLAMLIPALLLVPIVWLALGLFEIPFLLIIRYGLISDTKLTPNQIRHKPNMVETRAVMAMVAMYPIIALISQPWMPTESIREQGQRPFTGYVVGTSNGITAVIVKEKGKVRYMDPMTLARHICSDDHWWDRPPLQLFFPSPYPRCP